MRTGTDEQDKAWLVFCCSLYGSTLSLSLSLSLLLPHPISNGLTSLGATVPTPPPLPRPLRVHQDDMLVVQTCALASGVTASTVRGLRLHVRHVFTRCFLRKGSVHRLRTRRIRAKCDVNTGVQTLNPSCLQHGAAAAERPAKTTLAPQTSLDPGFCVSLDR